MPTDERRSGLSLEYKLPLLITALLIATMAAGLLFAYTEVQRAAVENSRSRLELVARDLANLLAPSFPARLERMRSIAANPAVIAYLSNPSPTSRVAALAALEELRLPAQPTARILLLDEEKVPLLEVGNPAVPTSAELPIDRLPTAGFGPFFELRDSANFWITVPIERGGLPLGEIAELRRVGGTGNTNPIEALLGENVQVRFGNTSIDGPWVGLDGGITTPPSFAPFAGPARYIGEDGVEFFVHSETIANSPWDVIALAPTSFVLARPNTFLRRAALAGLLFSLIGAMAAWALSRGITKPMKSLRLASEAIARGDYGRRIDLPRGDELGILATAYNHMAARVQTTHNELTAQYQTAQALADELDRASRAKSEFLATMSHEIRTPINAIIGYTDLLLLGVKGPVNPAQVGQLERVRVSGRHLVSLVDQILDLARVESGRLRVDLADAPASDSVDTAHTVLRPQAEAKGIEITAVCEDDMELRYFGDPQRVDQILVNLLSNAIKFTEPGGRVSIRCSSFVGSLPVDGRSGTWTHMTVEDSGLGIAPDQVESIFEAFVQVDSGYTRRHEGAGLGLAISLSLARSMGGDITVTSKLGVGSRFTLWLPLADAGVGAAASRGDGVEATEEEGVPSDLASRSPMD